MDANETKNQEMMKQQIKLMQEKGLLPKNLDITSLQFATGSKSSVLPGGVQNVEARDRGMSLMKDVEKTTLGILTTEQREQKELLEILNKKKKEKSKAAALAALAEADDLDQIPGELREEVENWYTMGLPKEFFTDKHRILDPEEILMKLISDPKYRDPVKDNLFNSIKSEISNLRIVFPNDVPEEERDASNVVFNTAKGIADAIADAVPQLTSSSDLKAAYNKFIKDVSHVIEEWLEGFKPPRFAKKWYDKLPFVGWIRGTRENYLHLFQDFVGNTLNIGTIIPAIISKITTGSWTSGAKPLGYVFGVGTVADFFLYVLTSVAEFIYKLSTGYESIARYGGLNTAASALSRMFFDTIVPNLLNSAGKKLYFTLINSKTREELDKRRETFLVAEEKRNAKKGLTRSEGDSLTAKEAKEFIDERLKNATGADISSMLSSYLGKEDKKKEYKPPQMSIAEAYMPDPEHDTTVTGSGWRAPRLHEILTSFENKNTLKHIPKPGERETQEEESLKRRRDALREYYREQRGKEPPRGMIERGMPKLASPIHVSAAEKVDRKVIPHPFIFGRKNKYRFRI